MDSSRADELLATMKKLEQLLQSPNVTGRIAKANDLANAIAKDAPNASVAELARKVMQEATAVGQDRSKLNKVLWHLRLELQRARRAQ